MTSQINFTDINANYPEAGKDNDSQGFRDNFSLIKTALSTASLELTNLQLNTARTDQNTNFNSYQITTAILKNNGQGLYGSDLAPVNVTSSPHTVYANQGDYQILSITTNTSFNFAISGWPGTGAGWQTNDVYRKITLEVRPSWSADTSVLTATSISSTFANPGGVLLKEASLTLPYVSNHAVVQLWEAWTTNAGADVFVKFVGTWTNV